MPNAAASIGAFHLTKRFGTVVAVDGLTLEVAPGEVVGFLGPNGAGKTTTIRTLLGFLRPSSGTVRVLGGNLLTAPRLRRRVGYLPGDFRVDERMTAHELFVWFRRLRGAGGDARADALCDRLTLDPTRPFATLSKGNRQKVGIIQAFMHDPDVLILDEPTTGLDPLMQRTFLELVSEAAGSGRAVLFSSHVLHEVERAATRVAIIRQGKLIRQSTVDGLLKDAVQHLELRFSRPVPLDLFTNVPGVSTADIDGNAATVRVNGAVGPAMAAAAGTGHLLRVRTGGDELEDIFLSLYDAERQ